MESKPHKHLRLVEGPKSSLTKAEFKEWQEATAALGFNTNKGKPPKWLSALAKQEFRRLAKELLEARLMTNVDVDMLAIYCDAYADYQTVDDPRRRKLLFEQMTEVAAEFGFTPYPRA